VQRVSIGRIQVECRQPGLELGDPCVQPGEVVLAGDPGGSVGDVPAVGGAEHGEKPGAFEPLHLGQLACQPGTQLFSGHRWSSFGAGDADVMRRRSVC
jgi:hypothetical protein